MPDRASPEFHPKAMRAIEQMTDRLFMTQPQTDMVIVIQLVGEAVLTKRTARESLSLHDENMAIQHAASILLHPEALS